MIELRTLGGIELRSADGRTLQSILAQPKRFALLVYLTVAGAPGVYHRRDALLAIFWPELDEERARAALRNALYFLRQSLGADVIKRRGDEEVGIDADLLRSDVARFERSGDIRDYGGEFLSGFHIDDAPDFEDWLSARRAELKRKAADAAWRAVDVSGLPRDEVLRAAQRAAELSEVSDATLRKLLLVHERAGDRAGAARAFDNYRLRMMQELEVEPSAGLYALRARLTRSAESVAEIAEPPLPELAEHLATRKSYRALLAGIAAVVTLMLAISVAVFARRSDPTLVVAVTTIRDLTGNDSAQYARSLPELLATSLSRAPAVDVISMARVYELMTPAEGVDTAAQLARAARRAGANQHIEGALYRMNDGRLRLDLRRVDAEDGEVQETHSVTGNDIFALVDNASARILPSRIDSKVPIAGVTTSSLLAWQLYERGLRALYHQNDHQAAVSYFKSAVEEDSTFAMAAHYVGWTTGDLDYIAKAVRMAPRATDRERLQILTMWSTYANQPRALALADTLASRYPRHAEAHLLRANALNQHGDFPAALIHAKRAVVLDSAGLQGKRPNCTACEALNALAFTYIALDSLNAAVAAAHTLLRHRPELDVSRHLTAAVLEAAGRYDDALRMSASAARRSVDDDMYPAIIALHKGDFDRANEVLRNRLKSAVLELRQEARWYYVIALRYQGRLREALALAQQKEAYDPLLDGLVLFESGQYREAGRVFERHAEDKTDPNPNMRARNRIWRLTHAATAYAAAGDTARVKEIATELQRLGPMSLYGRDRKLYRHVLGLVHAARGDHAAALSEYRAGMYSPTAGYIRGPLEAGRSALAIRRLDEAIAALQPAFRNSGLQSVSMYATRTELHEMLGHAWWAKGQRDSAVAHYEYVSRAWRNAEPQFHARRALVQQRLGRRAVPADATASAPR